MINPIIEVQCPYCASKGSVVIPSFYSVIVGPCPQCGELVLICLGQIRRLQKEIILYGSADDQFRHLTEVINQISDRMIKDVAKVIRDMIDDVDEIDLKVLQSYGQAEKISSDTIEEKTPRKSKVIQEEEINRFKSELNQIDDSKFFRKTFGQQ
ncbi:MAG: hypothetical protein A2114_01910 [Candidatus Vogelbacteria bacterium GWA1_51_14]|uniref:Uncharacterized protein n=1 Tax=Candidatus Vogelbacteria bacterium GWA1_51_14 TaxID=1802435 RepID=A0A1G2QAT8_9BACT|nr:MAG: hypothetical protein A2114_01910 [Candidatus Vogelbacteria bacterium GWA1_51_14]